MNSLNGTGDDIKKIFRGKYNEEIVVKLSEEYCWNQLFVQNV